MLLFILLFSNRMHKAVVSTKEVVGGFVVPSSLARSHFSPQILGRLRLPGFIEGGKLY
jgi:hypothetical protein